ncbi:MAG: N-acyl-D-amino-acid deacylase family protein [Bacillota bacterium]
MYISRKRFAAVLVLALAALSIFALCYSFLTSGSIKPDILSIDDPVECDLLIKNGTIVDGSGKASYRADIAVKGDKIVRIGSFPAEAGRVIDAEGLVIAPGFINPHSHIDQTIIDDPDARASLLQGVTTEIIGLDGLSPLDLDKHFAKISQKGIGINYGSLIGQGSVRQAVMGNAPRPATQEEIASMKALIKRAMEQGAFGLSTGLEYIPGEYTPTGEIIELAKAVTPFEGVYVSHIRSEGDNVLEAVKEALEIGRSAGIPAVISHIKVGSSIYDDSREEVIAKKTGEVLAAINEYRDDGGEAYADIYPYIVSWFRINKRPEQVVWNYPGKIVLVSSASRKNYIGKTIEEIAAGEKISPAAVARELAADPRALVCVQNLSETSMQRLLKAPFTVIGMDNTVYWGDPSYIPPKHPRNAGTYPRVLGEYVRSNKVLTLEEAVHKMTGMTAEIYGIDRRGLIKEGFFADFVIFDPEKIQDKATYWEPDLPPVGIEYVLVNGQTAVEKGDLVRTDTKKGAQGIRAGVIIRRNF